VVETPAIKELPMRRNLAWRPLIALAFLAMAAPARAEAPPKVVKESWDAAYLEGAKCGSFRSVTSALERDGQKIFRTTLTMNLRLRRYNSIVPLRMETADDETAGGKVVALSMTQFAEKGSLTQTGVVEGDELVVGVKGQPDTRRVKWDATVLGMGKQDSLFLDRKVKPGDHFSYRSFELSLLTAVTVRVAVKDFEEKDVLAPKKAGDKTVAERTKKRLLRADAVPDKVLVGDNEVQLPRLVTWLDEKQEVVRSEMELPGLGTITLYRTTKAIAEEEGAAPELMPDLGLNTLIPLSRALTRPHDAADIVYRVTVKGDDDPATTFSRDARQQVSEVKGSTFTLTVQRQVVPTEETGIEGVKPEFTQSSYFIDSNDERVRELTAAAVVNETDALRKAQRIERWVRDHMTGTSDVGFVPASHIARDLKGDCRQHAMLTAAMCRAAGVPARTAIGLVYVNDPDRGPVFGFHMWTEVWARGKWLGVDATLGRGGVGPAHLKVADASWHNTQTLAPLLPVIRVMGRLAIEVVKIENR
jgi:Transglutaminase-like superfamily